ncbi:MAG: gamma-glutamyltransferase [Phycisphaerae bacterium]|nr:gamma-glutamyltransferase [Phycisphaerae bacterium]
MLNESMMSVDQRAREGGAGAVGIGGTVVAAFPDAAEAGARVLALGGNAIDAACAAAWALSVCEPGESGLGGQTTMLIRHGDGSAVVLDGHSHAPSSLTRAKVNRRQQSRGLRATTVPSTPLVLGEAQRRYGRLALREVLAPAIGIASEGYRITRLQRRIFAWTARHFRPGSPEARHFPGGGVALRVGDVFRQPALAAALERIGREGVRDFYEGGIADEIVRDMRERGGLIRARDLRGMSLPVDRVPLRIEYRGNTVLSIPPPGGGVQVLLALRLLEIVMPGVVELPAWYSALARVTLASFRERERWADHPGDMGASLSEWLVSRGRAERIARDMGESRDIGGPGSMGGACDSGSGGGESGNTTHLCAADDEGRVVSLTQSIQSVFGAKVVHPTLGFVYNNYLSTCPRRAHPYRLGSGCLPQSNAAPTLVLRASGEPLLALGSAGSRRIASSVVQVVSAVVDRGLSVGAALGMARAHALLGGGVWAEESAGSEVLDALRAGFRKVRPRPPKSYKMGAVQAIYWDQAGRRVGAADPRRDGASAAFVRDS